MSKFKVGDVTTTRNGRKVRIICVDRASKAFPVIALVTDVELSEAVTVYTAEGKYFNTRDINGNDLTPPTRLEDLAIDAPILVRDSDSDPWEKRHFAGVFEGDLEDTCTAWIGGQTSHTTTSRYSWLLWKLP